jgi:nucleotide-binding universal stress UspA family protein
MFEKILYPTDFSDVSKDALDFIKTLENPGEKEIIVLHVMDARVMELSHRYAPDVIALIEKNMEENVSKSLQRIEENLRERGFTVRVRLERGTPFREILRVEEEENVSVTVIGSHGVSNVREMLLGSVSEKVVRKAKKPVLVIKR